MEMYSNTDQIPSWFWPVWGVLMIFFIACMWRIYTKCKEPGWAALVPIYNLFVMCRMVRKPRIFTFMVIGMVIYFLGFFLMAGGNSLGIPLTIIAGIGLLVLGIMLYHGLSQAFGQGAGFTVGLILLSVVFIPLLAFGNYEYVLDKAPAAGGEVLDA